MASVEEIAQYIYRRAVEKGVNPNLALGIAKYEGLNPKTIGSQYFGNRDADGTSYGPYQLFSRSKDPARLARGGMAWDFYKKYGEIPSASNWRQQVDFSLGTMRKTVAPWYAVRDQGGREAITNKGAVYAKALGLTPAGATVYSEEPSNIVTPTANTVVAEKNVTPKMPVGDAMSLGFRRMAAPVVNTVSGFLGQGDVMTPAPEPTKAEIATAKEMRSGFGDVASGLVGLAKIAALEEQANRPRPMGKPVGNTGMKQGIDLPGIFARRDPFSFLG